MSKENIMTTLVEKVQWMKEFAEQQGAELVLHGTVGVGRPCVGITKDDLYPSYDEYYVLWKPDCAYHKYPCVAVLIINDSYDEVLVQLYEWLKWFDDNGYSIQSRKVTTPLSSAELAFGKGNVVSMVKS